MSQQQILAGSGVGTGSSSGNSNQASANLARSLRVTADEIWKNRTEKVNAELFTLTYGAIVAELCRSCDRNFEKVNSKLFQMGYNIGVRLIRGFPGKDRPP